MAAILPAGTVANEDAQRQGTVSQFFYLIGDLMKGVDDQAVMDPSTRNTGVYGPAPTLGSVDIGVGANGEIFVRGRSGQGAANTTASQTQVAGFTVSPLVLIAGAALAWFIFKR